VLEPGGASGPRSRLRCGIAFQGGDRAISRSLEGFQPANSPPAVGSGRKGGYDGKEAGGSIGGSEEHA